MKPLILFLLLWCSPVWAEDVLSGNTCCPFANPCVICNESLMDNFTLVCISISDSWGSYNSNQEVFKADDEQLAKNIFEGNHGKCVVFKNNKRIYWELVQHTEYEVKEKENK